MAEQKTLSMKDQENTVLKAGGKLKPDKEEEIKKPITVRDGQLMAQFVVPHYRTGSDGERLVDLEFSFPLTAEHKGMLPDGVEDHWRHMWKNGVKSMAMIDIEPQTIDIRMAPDERDVELHLTAAEITKATLSLIEETGTGVTEKVIRFSFRVSTDVMKNVSLFADNQYGNVVWLTMKPTQRKLGE